MRGYRNVVIVVLVLIVWIVGTVIALKFLPEDDNLGDIDSKIVELQTELQGLRADIQDSVHLQEEVNRLQADVDFYQDLVDIGHARMVYVFLRMSELALGRQIDPAGDTPTDSFYALMLAQSEADWQTVYQFFAKEDRDVCSEDQFTNSMADVSVDGWTKLDIVILWQAVSGDGQHAIVYFTKGYEGQDDLTIWQLEDDGQWHLGPLGIDCSTESSP